MTTSPDLLRNHQRTYRGTGLWGSRRLMALREDFSLDSVDDDQAGEGENQPQGFIGTQAWQYAIEAGLPSIREVAGVMVPNVDEGLRITDSALQLKGTVLQTTNATDLEYYQPVTFAVPTTLLSSQNLTLLRRLCDLYSLSKSESWPDAERPTVQAFTDALTFIMLLPVHLNELPHISLANDGEVNFGWKNGSKYIDLGFYGTGTYSYFARGSDGLEYFGDDRPLLPPFPDDLFSLLSS